MEQTVQLLIDAMREAGTSMGQPAFAAAVSYVVAESITLMWVGGAFAALACILFVLGVLMVSARKETLVAEGVGVACLVLSILSFIIGVIMLAVNIPSYLAPEGYLVKLLVFRVLS